MGIKKHIRNNLLIFILCISMVCLVFSKYGLSMSLIALVSMLFFLKETETEYVLGLNPKIFKRPSSKNLFPFTGFLLFFLWIIVSVLWSGGQYAAWFSDVQSKLTILGAAVIFSLLPDFSNRDILRLHQIFSGAVFIGLLLVLCVYIPGYEDITLRIGRGRPIPTPIDHVRFSLMVSYACLSFAVFFIEGKRAGLGPKEKGFMLAGSILFFAFCHLLAVRTGLMLLYLGLFGLIVFYIFKRKKFLLGTLILVLLGIIPVIAYYTVESFRNKVYYTKYDIEQMLSNDGKNKSDGDRVRSIQEGISVWKKHPLLGTGAGEYKSEMTAYHFEHAPGTKNLLPHNQYVRAGMAYGWIGLILLLSGFGIILARRESWFNFLLLLICLLLFISLLVESNLDRYYALAFFMLFLGINSKLSWKGNLVS